ncbi:OLIGOPEPTIDE TRANSPORTER-RELATED [Salix viminalis]|uniref:OLIGOPEPTIDE TRANSPORTER-RELATED n=1 Tax=Salix viminalis TaxID=40686 RepID=A0A9Q0UHE4_SALVM|nr:OLIGOPEPTIDE TRANSPORTER-RELATED [Salix viminalis]
MLGSAPDFFSPPKHPNGDTCVWLTSACPLTTSNPPATNVSSHPHIRAHRRTSCSKNHRESNWNRQLQRIGVGLVLSAISMAVAGDVETRRKSVAIEHNTVDSIEPSPMSFLWLGFQYAIFGAADMFTLVGLREFFHAESSPGMKSLSHGVHWHLATS